VSESTIDRRRSTRTPVRTAHDRPSVRERVQPLANAWRPLAGAWAGLLIVVTAAGLLLVGPLEDGRIVRWDLDVEQWFADHRTSTLNTLAEAGTWLAETITVPVVLLIAVVIAWRVSSNVAAPAFLAVAVGGEKLLYLVSSLIVGRDRPPVPTVGTSYATSSFPSGHVASAITLYGGIALLIALRRTAAARILLLAVAGVIAAIVAACRMYAGFHFPSDCVAGVIVGVVWLTVTYRSVLRRTELAGGRPERSELEATAPGQEGPDGYRPPGKAAASTASA
jgi:membrane-associated phospholipid phosphatase